MRLEGCVNRNPPAGANSFAARPAGPAPAPRILRFAHPRPAAVATLFPPSQGRCLTPTRKTCPRSPREGRKRASRSCRACILSLVGPALSNFSRDSVACQETPFLYRKGIASPVPQRQSRITWRPSVFGIVQPGFTAAPPECNRHNPNAVTWCSAAFACPKLALHWWARTAKIAPPSQSHARHRLPTARVLWRIRWPRKQKSVWPLSGCCSSFWQARPGGVLPDGSEGELPTRPRPWLASRGPCIRILRSPCRRKRRRWLRPFRFARCLWRRPFACRIVPAGGVRRPLPPRLLLAPVRYPSRGPLHRRGQHWQSPCSIRLPVRPGDPIRWPLRSSPTNRAIHRAPRN